MKVAIIGAGVGGIATAIKLAQNGYQVTVYEKNATPGGRCGQLIRDGHRFDLGATIFLMPSIYRSVFESLGLHLEDCIESKPLPVIYKLYYGSGQTFDFTTNPSKMKAQMEKIESGSFQYMQRYIKTGYNLFKISMDKLLGRNFYHLFDFINFGNVKLLFQIKTHIRHMTYVRKFFKNPLLQVAFTFQNIYVGQNPFTAPALFSMLPAAELSEGSLYPIGGMYTIVEKLISVAKSLGVEFQYNKAVMRINVDAEVATGLLFEDGSELKAESLKDLEEHIKFEVCYLPKTWENVLNITKGSVFGSISHSILQMGYFRPHNKHPRYNNLYFVGGSTHPGNGVPLVLLSSKLTSERILSDAKKL